MRHVDRFALPFILLPVLLIANNGSDGSARAATCVARPTQWNIGGDSGQVNLMRSLPSRRLPVNSAPLKGQFRAGVTAARFSHRIQLTVESLPKQPGCFRLAEVNINFSIISPIRVHIASELKEGTCPYNVTLTHEFRHVEIARQNLKMMVESAETELPSLVGNSAIRASSLRNARRIFLDTLVRVYR